MNERDKQLIKNFLIGGAASGAAIAGTSAIIDYVKYLKEKAKMENDPDSLDDDTIYIDKRIPVGVKSASVGAGVAVAGGAASALATYVALSKMYQMLKKKQLQDDLDMAQAVYTDAVTKEASEGKPISAEEMTLTAGPIGALILAGLASGAITYQTLKKQFPSLAESRKKTTNIEVRPSRVETRYVDEEGNPIKSASVSDLTNEDYALGMAFAGFIAKQANDNNDLLDSLYNIFTDNRIEEFEDLIAAGDGAGLIEFSKQASYSENKLNADGLALVSAMLAKSSSTAPMFNLAVFDTLSEKSLYFFEKAASYDEETLTVLCKIAAAMGAQMIKDIPAISEVEEVEEEEGNEEGEKENEEEESSEEPEGEMSYIEKIISIIKDNPKKFIQTSSDLVDKAME
jgi:hypothetical protein